MQQLPTPPEALHCPLLQVCQYSYICTSKASTLVEVSGEQVCWMQGGSGRSIYRTQSAARVKQVRWHKSAVSSLLEAVSSLLVAAAAADIYRTQPAVASHQHQRLLRLKRACGSRCLQDTVCCCIASAGDDAAWQRYAAPCPLP